GDGKALLVELDRQPTLADSRVGEAQVVEGGALTAAVLELADDGKVLLVELDRAPRLAESHMGEAPVAEGVALAFAIADLPAGRQRCFQPADPLSRMEAELKAIHAGFGIVLAEDHGRPGVLRVGSSPGLTCPDVGPLRVKLPQAAEDVATALLIQRI